MKYIYCHPLFDERKCSYRFSYQLFDVFDKACLGLERFDYYGTGEQEGDFEHVFLDTLRYDMKNRIGAEEVCLIGLRLGANLAFDSFICNHKLVKKIILLEPVVEGEDYVKFLFRKQRIKDVLAGAVSHLSNQNEFINIEGYKTSAQFIEQLKLMSLKKMVAEADSIFGSVYLAFMSNSTKLSPGTIQFINLLKKKNGLRIEVEHFSSFPKFWRRVPCSDYSELTTKILEWTCE